MIKVILKELFGISVSAPFVRRADAFKLIKQKFTEGHADMAMRLIDEYNELYRRQRDKAIRPANVVRAIQRSRQEERKREHERSNR